ncbi:MAG: hypothetical protein EA362_05065 [Saprospirales bacterium]|nr:MAG: hypothetical protein EA362_05065 [Saprospirales bacterium]
MENQNILNNKIILHIPHSSTVIPLMDGYVVDFESLTEEMLKLTDWYTDDLFHSNDDKIVKADFSRIFCDPERFADDEQEIMSQYGMGVLYEKNDDGNKLKIYLRRSLIRFFVLSNETNRCFKTLYVVSTG